MPENDVPLVPSPSPEHRRVAAGQFERANQVIATGDYDYGIRLLLSCCKLDPANLVFRQSLRRTEKAKYKNNLRGSRLSFVFTWPRRAKIKAAKRGRDYLKVLHYGEEILALNPWDTAVQVDMAEAAEVLRLLDLAIWTLEQARHKNPHDVAVNRYLARLYERRGNFSQAIALWELIRKDDPNDPEAYTKSKDLAANETIVRGQYNSVAAAGPRDEDPDPAESHGKLETPRFAAPSDPQPTPLPAASVAGPTAGDRWAREAAPLRDLIRANPADPLGYLRLAHFFRRANKFEQARTALEEGLAPTANAAVLTFELADLDIEPFRRNLLLTDEKLRTDSGNEELRKIRVRLLKEINTRELELFRQKAERQPGEMGHRFELGLRLLRAGQLDEAIRELQIARQDARFLWRSLLYLGYCFKSRNNWRLARRNFEECLETLPVGEDAARKEILFQLAQGSAEAGDYRTALDRGNDLANLDFTYRDIGKLLDTWEQRRQQAEVSQ